MHFISYLYKKNELVFSLICIYLYILVNTIFDQMLFKLLLNSFLLVLLMMFIKYNSLFVYYRFNNNDLDKKYLLLFYILSFFNLGCGLNFKGFSVLELLLMIEIGIIEELLFRAILFKAIEKYSLNRALIITSISFALGHLFNLFNGMNIIDNLMQIVFALCIGFLYGLVLIRGNSIYPCIISHAIIDATSIISVDENDIYYFASLIIIVLILIYRIWRNHE